MALLLSSWRDLTAFIALVHAVLTFSTNEFDSSSLITPSKLISASFIRKSFNVFVFSLTFCWNSGLIFLLNSLYISPLASNSFLDLAFVPLNLDTALSKKLISSVV